MSAKNNFSFSPVLGRKEQNQCWVLLQADGWQWNDVIQNTQSRETEKSATTKEHSKVNNSYRFTVSPLISK